MKGEIIKEHDRVVLKVDLPAEGLKAGDAGTVVHLYRDGLAALHEALPKQSAGNPGSAGPTDGDVPERGTF